MSFSGKMVSVLIGWGNNSSVLTGTPFISCVSSFSSSSRSTLSSEKVASSESQEWSKCDRDDNTQCKDYKNIRDIAR